MPEEQAPEETQETPPTPASGPDEGTPAEPESKQEEGSQPAPDDWRERAERAEKRAEDLLSNTTKAQQEAAEHRQIIELARRGDAEALEYLGLEAEEDTEDDEYLSEEERLDRLEGLYVQRVEEEQRRAQDHEHQEEVLDSLAEQLDVLEKEHGEIADEDLDFLCRLAENFPDEEGLPDLKAAYEYDSQRLEAKRKAYVQSKRTPQVQSGASGQQNIDLGDAEQRREYLARRLTETEA